MFSLFKKMENMKIKIHEDFHCCVGPWFFAFLIWFSGSASKDKKEKI